MEDAEEIEFASPMSTSLGVVWDKELSMDLVFMILVKVFGDEVLCDPVAVCESMKRRRNRFKYSESEKIFLG